MGLQDQSEPWRAILEGWCPNGHGRLEPVELDGEMWGRCPAGCCYNASQDGDGRYGWRCRSGA